MSQLEANIEEMNNTDINFDGNMLPPAPASVKRDVTVVLDNISYEHHFNMPMPIPPLQRILTTYGKHGTPGANFVDIEEDEDFKLPERPVRIERQTTTWTGKDGELVYNLPKYSNSFVSSICDNDLPPPIHNTEELIQEAYRQELLVCPGLEFKREHYSGLPYDPIYLTHLIDEIREHLESKMPFPKPKLERQTNGPSYSGPSIGDELYNLEDDMPPTNPVFMRMDSESHYINPFGRNDSS
jgi:hypothetical protein